MSGPWKTSGLSAVAFGTSVVTLGLLASGCEPIQLPDNVQIVVASPSPSTDTKTSPTPSSTPSVTPSATPTSTPTPAPTVSPPVSVGAKITDIQVNATSSLTAQLNVPITFGIPFPKGALPAGKVGVLRDPSTQSIIPTQFEIKAKHDDGSARHAIVTALHKFWRCLQKHRRLNDLKSCVRKPRDGNSP